MRFYPANRRPRYQRMPRDSLAQIKREPANARRRIAREWRRWQDHQRYKARFDEISGLLNCVAESPRGRLWASRRLTSCR
jgi:hypothetical protein